MKIIDSPSPNQNERPAGVSPRLIVIHGTVGSDAGDLSHICNPESKVSYHYLVQRPGTIHRLVRPERRAWHAGKSTWRGDSDVNDFSIGIGLSNMGGSERFTEEQYTAAGWLCSVFIREFDNGYEDIVGHYHISPGRKTDPWYTFEWGRLFARIASS